MKPDGAAPAAVVDDGALRAEAARALVQQLQAKKAVYGHELDLTAKGGPSRKEGVWWNETEFDCSKFVLWVLAGRQVGSPGRAAKESESSAMRGVRTKEFGAVSESSSVSAMVTSWGGS